MKKLLALFILTSSLSGANLTDSNLPLGAAGNNTTICTGSMYPMFPRNGYAVYSWERRPYASLAVGDVVIYRSSVLSQRYGGLTLHRIVRKYVRRNGEVVYVMRGDANRADDPGYLTASNYIASVVSINAISTIVK